MRFISFIFCILSFTTIAQMTLSWSFLHPIKKEWIELGEKGSIQEVLIANGDLPDPFYGLNEDKFGWIEEHQWEFKSIFFLDSGIFDLQFIEVEFPSIDTYASVYLNDSLVLCADNAFIPHRSQIKKSAKKGLNEFKIIFTPPIIYHKNKKEEVGYELPAPNDNHKNAIAPYTRKPQYQFGWDWALRMNTIGLNKAVNVHAYNNARIINKTTRVLSIEQDIAVLEFDLYLSNPEMKSIEWESTLFGKQKVIGENGVFTRREEVKDPNLWWPRGQGDQYLYEDQFRIYDTNSVDIGRCDNIFGIKIAELIQEDDEWGTSYYFKINGRRIFSKGANYIPQEIFPAKVKDQEIEKMIELMAESNFNMVRVWGGGYYPDDVFYHKCDELGIMVWQDLMFACAMYPGDSAFISNITREFNYQIPRISGHPSTVLFNGNNEVKVAWNNWGFQIKYGLFGKSAKQIEEAYDLVFRRTAPDIVTKNNTIPYVHTSPLSNWGKTELYNHGSQHYWGVWHGKDPMEDFGKKIGRFNAEYGFQSFPEFNTLRSFSEKKDWDLSSDVMKHHQKSYVGNDMILKHAKKLYGVPKDFEEFVYFSQLTQSQAVSMAVAGHRIDAPRCGGTLYWQLNDCWPAPTWSSVDYFGNWKALQYQIKEDYRDVGIVAKYKDHISRDFYLVSDVPDSFHCNITCKVYELSGVLLLENDMSLNINGAGSVKLDLSLLHAQRIFEKNVVLVFQFKDHEGQHCTRQFEHIVTKYQKAKNKEVSIAYEKINHDSKTAIIKIDNKKFLRKLWISSDIAGVRFDKNFISYLPGNSYVSISFDDLPDIDQFTLKWM